MIHKELSKYLAERRATAVIYADGSCSITEGHVVTALDTVNELTAMVRSRELGELKKELEDARKRVQNLESRHMKLCYSDPVPQPDLEFNGGDV